MVFLGVLLDTCPKMATLPDEKLQAYVSDIRIFLASTRKTLKDFQRIVGQLQWANRVIIPGRPFLRRLIDGMQGLTSAHSTIFISRDMKLDLEIWLYFMENFNGKSFFIKPVTLTSADLHFYSDASGKAAGAYYGSRWFYVVFPDEWVDLGITFKELYPIMVAMCMYSHLMRNHKVMFHTDNKGAMFVVNKQTSKSPSIMTLVRKLVLAALSFNVHFSATFIEGQLNLMADKISRFQVTEGNLVQHGMCLQPDVVPRQLQPKQWVLP